MSCNGTAITYDAVGNPTKWRNAVAIEWYGRQMSLFAHADGSVTNYSYNADGIRTGIPTVKAMEYYNWGIFTPNKLDAERYALFSFGGFIYEENGLSHSPLPHLHAPGHSITIDKETNPHILYLQ